MKPTRQVYGTGKGATLLLALVIAFGCAIVPSELKAKTPHNFIPGSLSWNIPTGPLKDQVGAKSAIGFALGYKFAGSKHLRYGARGTWTQLSLDSVDGVDFSDLSLTHVGIMAGAQYRFLKHGWSPYVEGEVGMGLVFASVAIDQVPQKIDGLSEVKFSAAGLVGVLIPLSRTIDVDVAGRWQSTFLDNRLDIISAHLGIVYAIN